MSKQIVWRQVEASKSTLAAWLTEHNFQPGKFVVFEHQFNKDKCIVVFVELEAPPIKRLKDEG